jgi:hypothetical protein
MTVSELVGVLSGLNSNAEVYVLGYENDGDADLSTELRSFLYDGEILELRGPVIK